jgi:glutaredoxin
MGCRFAFVIALAVATAAAGQTLYRWVDKDGRVHYSDQPSSEAKSLQEKRLGSPNFIDTSTPSYATRKAQQEFPVTLYTAADCQAECKSAREFLGRRGVPFVEVPVKSEQEAAQFKLVFGGGDVFVPSLTVGVQKQKGFEEGAWTRLLDDAGYPKSAVPSAAAKKPAAPAPKPE